MSSLLEKSRILNKILQDLDLEPLDFHKISNILKQVMQGNVYIISRKGKILGVALHEEIKCGVSETTALNELRFSNEYNRKLLQIKKTVSNVKLDSMCVFDEMKTCTQEDKHYMIVPIIGNGGRLGTLLFVRFEKEFDDDDIVLAEYSATIVGLEILRSKADEFAKEERKKSVVQAAISTLSYSELEAVEHILSELQGNEGLLVASKIADKVGITRSVIVNAIRKFESAGVIESRSLGMKGTYIKITNEKLVEEFKK